MTLYGEAEVEAADPPGGEWELTANVPGGCSNAILGPARCLVYHARTADGLLTVQMMGLDRDEGNRVVESIPL